MYSDQQCFDWWWWSSFISFIFCFLDQKCGMSLWVFLMYNLFLEGRDCLFYFCCFMDEKVSFFQQTAFMQFFGGCCQVRFYFFLSGRTCRGFVLFVVQLVSKLGFFFSLGRFLVYCKLERIQFKFSQNGLDWE